MGIFKRKDKNKYDDEKYKNYILKTNPDEKGRNAVWISSIKRNEINKNLITARILRYRDGDCIMPDLSDYICFEIPESLTIEKLQKMKIFDGLEQINLLNNLEPGIYNHIGKICKNQDESYYVESANEQDRNFVKLNLNKEIEENNTIRQEKINNSMEERKKTEEAFREELKKKTMQHMQQTDMLSKDRIQNATLTYITSIQEIKDGVMKNFNYYKGTDINNGNILNLNKTNKICKDIDGRYLYSTYLNSTVSENEAQKLNLNGEVGCPVIFEMPYRIEDAVKSGREELIMPILDLLSVDKTIQLSNNEMTYLGRIKEGKVERENVSTQELKNKIVSEMTKCNMELQKGREQDRDE